jgi:hypothetical protein
MPASRRLAFLLLQDLQLAKPPKQGPREGSESGLRPGLALPK